MTIASYFAREVRLGEIPVLRALPAIGRRTIGPWCFIDRFGPLSFTDARPMDVAPHPHMGLQTITWLLEGEIVHDDSLGSEALLRPGGLNVMTSGAAIAHAEQTPRAHTGHLHGVQLWTALPESHRHGSPSFQHLAEVPMAEWPGGIARIFSGSVGGVASAAPHVSPIVGADLQVHPTSRLSIPMDASYEHGVLILSGDAAIDDQPLEARTLYYIEPGRAEATVSSRDGARVLLIGGAPFQERILMWWNFVARTPEEIRAAREEWTEHRRFGEVTAYRGARLEAPELTTRLAAPNPVS
ncbi:MAG TPA: pirin family protein [Vicinamibacterales bacterium]|nr:pirin family protein [Vicinamibacterales bacterium]